MKADIEVCQLCLHLLGGKSEVEVLSMLFNFLGFGVSQVISPDAVVGGDPLEGQLRSSLYYLVAEM